MRRLILLANASDILPYFSREDVILDLTQDVLAQIQKRSFDRIVVSRAAYNHLSQTREWYDLKAVLLHSLSVHRKNADVERELQVVSEDHHIKKIPQATTAQLAVDDFPDPFA